jgi:pteridine reductase
VAVHYHSSAREAKSLIQELMEGGSDAMEVQADLSSPEDIQGLFQAVEAGLGGLDLLVNSAATFGRSDSRAVTATECDRTFEVNARAPFLCAQAAARLMGRGGGSIVNVADVAAFEAWPAYIPYAASKAALVSLTRGLALAWAPEIRVNAVAPGAVLLPEGEDSPKERAAAVSRAALERLGTPEDVAEAVLYLDRAAYVTGEVIRVDGGQHLK